MISTDIEIINKLGLHARASTKLTQTASKFASEIWITRNGRRVNAKSIMGVMMLAAAKGSMVTLDATGEDETDQLPAEGQGPHSRHGLGGSNHSGNRSGIVGRLARPSGRSSRHRIEKRSSDPNGAAGCVINLRL